MKTKFYTVYLEGEPYKINQNEFDFLAEFGPDVRAGDMRSEVATAYVLFVAGYISQIKYVEIRNNI